MTVDITAFEGRIASEPQLYQSTTGQALCEAIILINRRTKNAAGKWRDAEPARRLIRASDARAEQLAALPVGTTVVVIGTIESEFGPSIHGEDADEQRDVVTVESLGQGLLIERADVTEHINLLRRARSQTDQQ